MSLPLQYTALISLVLMGFLLGVFVGEKKAPYTKLLLVFSGAFLLGTTFFELVPEIYQQEDHRRLTLFVLAGILLQTFLEFFSKGAEHGHTHNRFSQKSFPWVLFLSLSAHALLEGAPLSEDSNLVFGILVHKIPVAILLGILFRSAEIPKTLTVLFAIGFSLMSPLGNILMNQDWSLPYQSEVTALSVGILFHVATIIIFETSQDHRFNLRKLVVVCLGIVMSYLL